MQEKTAQQFPDLFCRTEQNSGCISFISFFFFAFYCAQHYEMTAIHKWCLITHALSDHSPPQPKWPLLPHAASFMPSWPGSAGHGGSSDRAAPSPHRAPLRGLSAPGTPAGSEAHTETPLPASCQHHRGPHNPAPRSPARPGRAASSRPAFPGPPPLARRALKRGAGPAPPERLAGGRRGRRLSGTAAEEKKEEDEEEPRPRTQVPLTRIYRQRRRHLGEREARWPRRRPRKARQHPGLPAAAPPQKRGSVSRRRRTGRGASRRSPSPFWVWGSPAGES